MLSLTYEDLISFLDSPQSSKIRLLLSIQYSFSQLTLGAASIVKMGLGIVDVKNRQVPGTPLLGC